MYSGLEYKNIAVSNSGRRLLHLLITIAVILLIFIHYAMPWDCFAGVNDFIVQFVSRYVDTDPELLSVIVRNSVRVLEFAILGICIAVNIHDYSRRKSAHASGTEMKHARNEQGKTGNTEGKKPRKKRRKNSKKRKRQLKHLKALLILLVIAIAGAGITIYRDYQARPGFLEKIWISDRGADYITVAWERPRNVYRYVVTYNGETVNVSGRRNNVKLTGLDADTNYKISVRADSKEREGFEEISEQARTKKTQTIEGEAPRMTLPNKPVDLKQTAQTALSYVPGKGYTVTEDGKIVFTSGGNITVTAMAAETEEYAAATKEITVEVLDMVSVGAAGASPHIFYKLNKENCECVMSIDGTKEASTPQSFIRTDGKYIVSFIKDDNQRLVEFGAEKTVHTPETDLGHANGLTIANGRCYSVRGAGSTQCITFDPPNSNYNSFELTYGASGIGYDEANGLFYTSSRSLLVAYDSNFNVVNKVRRIRRKSTYYVQDCTAYNGILMQGVSGEGFVGTNYIDFYDMINSKYLGSIECELDEIESIIVDEEGYIEVLCNVIGYPDYIWKTPFNMKLLCAE